MFYCATCGIEIFIRITTKIDYYHTHFASSMILLQSNIMNTYVVVNIHLELLFFHQIYFIK